MGQHATVALSFQIEIYNLDRTKSHFHKKIESQGFITTRRYVCLLHYIKVTWSGRELDGRLRYMW